MGSHQWAAIETYTITIHSLFNNQVILTIVYADNHRANVMLFWEAGGRGERDRGERGERALRPHRVVTHRSSIAAHESVNATMSKRWYVRSVSECFSQSNLDQNACSSEASAA